MSPERSRRPTRSTTSTDIVCGSHNLIDEGYFDSGTMFDWWRRKARQNGAEYLTNEVVSREPAGRRGHRHHADVGESVNCGTLVNAAGPRAVEWRDGGAELPVEPRKRYTFMFMRS